MRGKDLTKQQDKKSKDTLIKSRKNSNLQDFLQRSRVLLHAHLDFLKFYVEMKEDKVKNKENELLIIKVFFK